MREILLALLLCSSAFAQNRFILWKQVDGKVYNFSDSAKVTDMRKIGSYYRVQAYGGNFWAKNDTLWGGVGGAAWGSITGTLNDQTDLKDTFALMTRITRFTTDSTKVWDSLATKLRATRFTSDSGKVWDSLATKLKTTRFTADSIRLNDTAAVKLTIGRFTSDSAKVWDSLAIKLATSRFTTDSVRIKDSLAIKQSTSAKGVANGYAGLGANALVPTAQLGTGSASSSTYLRGDQTWGTPGSGPATGPDSTWTQTVWMMQANLGTLTTIANVGFATAPTVTGTATALQDTFGKFINYATAATLDSSSGWRSAAFTEFNLAMAPELTFHIKTGPNATDTNKCVYWIGFVGGNYKRLADSAGWNIAAFRYATAAGYDSLDRTWKLVTKSGGALGTITATNTNVPIATSKSYKMTIRTFVSPDNTAIDSIVGYINGARVACNTTNIPNLTTNLGYYARICTKAAVAKNIRIAKLYGKQR